MGYYVNIVGFHGTNSTAANTIIREKRFIAKENKNHWLGQGIYFFREDDEQAMSWAINKAKETKDSEAVVLKVEIDVENKYFLHLNNRGHLFKLKKIIKTIHRELISIQRELATDPNKEFDKDAYRCAVLDLIPTHVIKVIQGNFPFKQPSSLTLPEFELMDIKMQSIQVCVRDHDLIQKDKIEKYRSYPLNKKSRRNLYKIKLIKEE